MEPRSPSEVSSADGLGDWRIVARALHAAFATGSFAAGIELADRIAVAADAADHHPDLTVTYPRVLVRLTTHDAGGLTDRDVDLARTISSIARELDIGAEPARPAAMEVAIDAMDIPTVRRFWHAALGLGGSPDDADELVDPTGQLPTLWFQQMDEPRPQRNRIHLDLLLPHDLVEDRLAAVLAAGGTRRGDEAPSFWVLADAEGNEVCLCTWRSAADPEP